MTGPGEKGGPPADLSLGRVLHPQPLVGEPRPEVVLAHVDAAELGRVEDMRHADALEVLLLPDGGSVTQHYSGKDFVTVNSVPDKFRKYF